MSMLIKCQIPSMLRFRVYRSFEVASSFCSLMTRRPDTYYAIWCGICIAGNGIVPSSIIILLLLSSLLSIITKQHRQRRNLITFERGTKIFLEMLRQLSRPTKSGVGSGC